MDTRSGTARTRLATLIATRLLGSVSFSGRATVGVTTASKASGLLRFDRELVSSAFALDAGHDMLGGVTILRLSSPLKLERGNARVLAPLSYDLMTGRLVTGMTPVDLAPTSRELDLEFGWAAALSETSSVRFGIARAFNAGHVAGVQSTAGFASLVVR